MTGATTEAERWISSAASTCGSKRRTTRPGALRCRFRSPGSQRTRYGVTSIRRRAMRAEAIISSLPRSADLICRFTASPTLTLRGVRRPIRNSFRFPARPDCFWADSDYWAHWRSVASKTIRERLYPGPYAPGANDEDSRQLNFTRVSCVHDRTKQSIGATRTLRHGRG